MRIALLAALAIQMMAADRILVHGHRGARAVMPENSLPAFEYALAQGVDALEMNLAVTKDNVLVVSHDPELSAKLCKGPEGSPRIIRQLTLAELKKWECGVVANPDFPKQKAIAGTRVPTFDEVLRLAKPTRVELNVETKSFPSRPELTPAPEEFSRLVIEAVRKHGMESRLILQSFDWRTLAAAKQIAPKVRLSALYPFSMTEPWQSAVTDAHAKGFQIVSPHYRVATAAEIEKAHKLGMHVVPWTANEPKIWDALIDAKADAIITDDPAALVAYLKSKGLR